MNKKTPIKINNIKKTFDFTGIKCPLPVLKTRRALSELKIGEIIEIFTDDPASPLDMAHFCNTNGHNLLETKTIKKKFIFVIEKKETL